MVRLICLLMSLSILQLQQSLPQQANEDGNGWETDLHICAP